MENGYSFISEAMSTFIVLGNVWGALLFVMVADPHQEGERLYISIWQTRWDG